MTLTQFSAYDDPSNAMPARITLPEDRITDFSRDALGDVTALTRRNAAGTVSLTRSYVRNAHRELCKQIDPESGATVRDFDAAGNVSWQASGLNLPSTTNCDTASAYSSGRRMDLTWDARNRETARSYPDGMGNATTTYWPDGLVNTQTAYNGPSNTVPVITTHSFNKRRLPITETSSQPGWYGWSVQRGYDTAANPNSITYPNGLIVNYAPNALGQPTQVTASDGTTLASSILFYPNGALKQFNYGNGIAHTMTQNARQLPARSLDAGVIDENYVYDANANTVAINDPIAGTAGNRAMTYDLGDRLLTTSATIFGGDGVHRNTYDALDNIKSWKLTGVKDYASYVYDARNLPTQINNTAGSVLVTQTFDVQGNLSNKNGQGYQFDYGNRLRAVTGIEVSRYDAAGRRVTRWPSTGEGVLAMYTADNAFLYAENHRAAVRKRFTYVQLQGSLLATLENDIPSNTNAWKYQHTDALGSPIATTNAAGAVTERTNYEPWGAAIGKPALDARGYTGHQMDGTTGLIYMQQRYYDPQLGQFLSTDPVYVDFNTGSQFNRGNYANNNPNRFTDPDGRQDRVYGAGTSLMLTPEERRIWEAGERAATTEGSRALEGATIIDAVKTFAANPKITRENVAQLATVIVMAKLTHGKNVSAGVGAKISNLSAGELKRIQNAANRSGVTITVVGSRAAGTARSNSDWDYVVDSNSKTRSKLSRSLPGAGNLNEGQRPNIDVFRGEVDKSRPYIEVKPEP
ncbi:RHS repeat-associated core domain-containing protein [Aquilutibacter rugosus]|uniref:RHS repeat-associated core domain-containing protein n=1 Tax=Aquilutibacter rugosus TaxID=3115820 RepID=UPI002F3E969B